MMKYLHSIITAVAAAAVFFGAYLSASNSDPAQSFRIVIFAGVIAFVCGIGLGTAPETYSPKEKVEDDELSELEDTK